MPKFPSQSTQKSARTWISFVAGLVFLTKFAFYTPDRINAYLTSLIAALLFGPSVYNVWKSGGGRDDNEHN